MIMLGMIGGILFLIAFLKLRDISDRLDYLNNRYHTLIEEMEYYRRTMKNERE